MSMFLCALIAELQKGTWAFEMGTEHLVQEPRNEDVRRKIKAISLKDNDISISIFV